MMRSALLIAATALSVACGRDDNEPPKPLVSNEERGIAMGVPSFANSEFTVSGVAEKLYGAANLSVGPGTIEQLILSAHSVDMKRSLTADIDMTRLTPRLTRLQGTDVELHFTRTQGSSWLEVKPGSVFLGVSGEVSEAFVYDLSVRIDRTGVVVLEARVVPATLLNLSDGTWPAGSEVVVKAVGRLSHTCRTYGGGNAVLLVPEDNIPRCQELFHAP